MPDSRIIETIPGKEVGLEDVDDKTFNRAWEITKELNENIRHYNEHQTKYRSLASQWLIGAFAAMGFVLISKIELPFEKLWLIAVISLVAASGIFQLWRMDIPVFQKIISAFFSSGLDLESKYRFLPPVKTKILKYVKNHNAGQTLFYFYFLIMAVFILIAANIIIYLTYIKDSVIGLISACTIIVLFLFFLHRYMRNRSIGVEAKYIKRKAYQMYNYKKI